MDYRLEIFVRCCTQARWAKNLMSRKTIDPSIDAMFDSQAAALSSARGLRRAWAVRPLIPAQEG